MEQCDEAQPSCKKCRLYGVACDYSGEASSLDLNASGSFQVRFDPSPPVEMYMRSSSEVIKRRTAAVKMITPSPLDHISLNASLATMINDSLCFGTLESGGMEKPWKFTSNQLEVVSRFRERTSLTLGDPQTTLLYRDLICQLACRVMSHVYQISPSY